MQKSIKQKPDQLESMTNFYISHLSSLSSDPSSEFNDPSSEHFENCKYLIKSLNNLALDPKTQNTKKSFHFLSKALKLSTFLYKHLKVSFPASQFFESILKMRSLTLNNLACYFKTCEKLVTAHSYLEKALKLEKKGKIDEYEVSTTLLNLTAVLSKMRNHEKAVVHALEAVKLLETVDEDKPVPEALTTAYFNYAVELEYLNRTKEAKVYYEKAYEVSQQRWGENSQRTQNFLEKLVEFNFSNPETSALDVRSSASFASTANKSPDISETNMRNAVDLLVTVYKTWGNVKYKVFIINKPGKSAVKVLAFPKEKYPVYRMLITYQDLLSILKDPHDKPIPKYLSSSHLSSLSSKLLPHLHLSRGSLKLLDKPRPFSAYEKPQ